MSSKRASDPTLGTRHIRELSTDIGPSRRPNRTCIVTPELAGVNKNGGVGTAFRQLALALERAGHAVTIVHLPIFGNDESQFKSAVQDFRKLGILLTSFRSSPPRFWTSPARNWPENEVRLSYELYRWLKDHESDFDVVYFPEWIGLGYYSFLAKSEGIAFTNITMVVNCHGPTRWVLPRDSRYVGSLEILEIDFMERRSVELADVAISPSRYLFNWMQEQDWILPERSYVHRNVLDRELRVPWGRRNRESEVFSELVFFGRLEARKGLKLFCDALDLLAKNSPENLDAITFLGKGVLVMGIPSTDYIRRRSRSWPWRCEILSDFGYREAVEYLSTGNRLAVIASLGENSPYSVLECIGVGIPFITTAVGGIPELLSAEDGMSFEPRPRALAAKIDEMFTKPFQPIHVTFDFDEDEHIWTDWHASQMAHEAPKNPLKYKPFAQAVTHPRISVCVTHHDRPEMLQQALDSLDEQTFKDFEVIVVDDGSEQRSSHAKLDELEAAFEGREWKLLRQDNLYLGAARNAAARAASGDYLLFMDDDNYAKAEELETFITIAERTGADILTCFNESFSGPYRPVERPGAERIFGFLGPALEVGAFANSFGDANALIRRDTFEALGGFTEDYGLGHEDWEFFAGAVLAGYRLEVIPEPLYWYRRDDQSMLSTADTAANNARSFRPYLASVPRELHGVLLLAQGHFFIGVHPQPSIQLGEDSTDSSSDGSLAELIVDWNSRSWRISRPLRNFVLKRQGRPLEPKELSGFAHMSQPQAAEMLKAMHSSTAWELTGPLRVLRRIRARRGLWHKQD